MIAHLPGAPWPPGAHGTYHPLLQAAGTLTGACGPRPGIACRLAWDLTHDLMITSLASAFLAGPVKLALRIAFVVALALIARAVVHRMISRLTQRAAEPGIRRAEAALLLGGERRSQRAQALGSLLRNLSSVVIFGIAGVTIAGDLGLNLAPLLASAGVLGLAIGFGAQSLVKDFLAGIFMLLEDQYGVGDVIDAGAASGTVEAVSLRTTRLRDVDGVVWHIRNGTINRIGNKSQSWARAVVDFPVPRTEDITRVRALMERTAGEVWAEPHWRELILEPPEVWGAESVTSEAVVMRLVARTPPLRQWEVARALRERLKNALAPVDAAVAGDGPTGPVIASPPGPPPGQPDAPATVIPSPPGPPLTPPVQPPSAEAR